MILDTRETTISVWARRVIEACWLLALVMIPVYFSLLSDRHFEPDKAAVLRSLATITVGAWLIRILERGQVFRVWPRLRSWWHAPLIAPAVIYVGIFLLTTFTSILVFTSFFGGYNRLQGFYTNLSYAIMFGAIVAHVRSKEQLQRIISVMIVTTLPVIGYAWLQYRRIDPLPWAGDTATRVASTMGNSIFVAAYLILVLPFMLYRVALSLRQLNTQPETNGHRAGIGVDVGWLIALALPSIAMVVLLNGVLKLGLLYQNPLSLGHWWMFPFAVIATGSMLPLVSYRTMNSSRTDWRLYVPGVLVLLYVFGLLAAGYLTAPMCGNSADACLNTGASTAKNAADFKTWLLLALALYAAFYALVFALPRRSVEPSRTISIVSAITNALLALLTIWVVFMTQSRGPQIGMFVSLFVFITLVLLQGLRTTSAKKIFGGLLTAWVVVSLLAGAFLVILNTNTASFSSLRESNRTIARLGNLLETDGGTGLVRVLIWRGDETTRGAVGLVTSNPFRTVVGWGPEAMFVAYNPFYPPKLANYESRGASPDRSHQAMLDELVTKGGLGLFSHLFLYGSFAILMMRLLRVPRLLNLILTSLFMLSIAAFFTIFLKSVELGIIALIAGMVAIGLAAWLKYANPLDHHLAFRWQLLIIAAIASVVANFVENIFGIPIVSSLLYTWVAMGIGIVVGMFAGAYTLGEPAAEPTPAVVETPSEEIKAQPSKGQNKQRNQAKRPTTARASGRSRSGGANAPARIFYALIIPVVLAAVWFLNLDNTYADMRFLQAKQWADQQGLQPHVLSYAAIRDAIDAAPNEDLYYLTYGRILLSLAFDISQTQSQELNTNPTAQLQAIINQQPRPNASLDDLPTTSYSREAIQPTAQALVSRFGALQMLDYARLALEEAQRLNPRNKDHPANLGRLHASWYQNILATDPQGAARQLDLAIASYGEAHRVAPQDVELTGQWAMLYLYKKDYDSAIRELEQAAKLDPIYAPTFVRLGEAKRQKGDLAGASEAFSQAIALDPYSINNAQIDVAEGNGTPQRAERIKATFDMMKANPTYTAMLVSGYAKAVERRPNDLGYRHSYTQVLSDTGNYQEGLNQAQTALTLNPNEQQRQIFQAFVDYLKTKVN